MHLDSQKREIHVSPMHVHAIIALLKNENLTLVKRKYGETV